jgi:cysteine desulfurase
MSFTAHKIYGPKGIGALYVRRHDPIVRLEPQIVGGGQQEGRRSGTLNVPGVVGFAEALRLCVDAMPDETARLTALRDRLAERLFRELDGIQLCGPALDARDDAGLPLRLAGNLNLSFGNVDGEALLLAMGNLAVSSGAACTSTDSGPSHVLLATGLDDDAARSSLRFGLGRFNTEAEIDSAADTVVQAVRELRTLAAAPLAKTGP